MTERNNPQEKDVCIAVLLELKDKALKPQELSDKLWEEMRSPVATIPAINAVLNFYGRKDLVSTKRGKYSLTNEGRRAIDVFFQNNPELSLLYGQ